MKTKFYIAINADVLEPKNNTHIFSGHTTLAFLTPKETEKISALDLLLPEDDSVGVVKEIVYWEKADLTVMLVDCPSSLLKLQKKLSNKGFSYEEFEFIPHITIGKGNQIEKFKHFKGNTIEFYDVYFRMKDF